jgi:hypothetical protein
MTTAAAEQLGAPLGALFLVGRYFVSDRQSDWAVRARRSLKFCEMQTQLVASRS